MPSTTTYKQGDVVLVYYPFADQAAAKKRPALVVSADWYHQATGKYILSAITSSVPLKLADHELAIQGRDYEMAGLSKPSIVRCEMLFTIEPNRIEKRLGDLPRGTVSKALAIIDSLFKTR